MEMLVAQKRSVVKNYSNNGHIKYIIKFRNESQKYLQQLFDNNTLLFILGPAGTGKTFMATALAVREIYEERAEEIILTRPIVESQESLGYLPGDIKEKTDPYMSPIFEQYKKCVHSCKEKLIGRMKVQPLAYTRGHTFENSICILDEAQNCNYKQLKLYLTRLAEDSKCIITGDLSQIDVLDSGLGEVISRLRDIKNIAVFRFTEDDIVRHQLVKDICRVL
jgi:phosphate starvation-inducible PhoH-like protein